MSVTIRYCWGVAMAAACGAAGFAQEGVTSKLRVALLLPGRENDRGWNQLAYEAAKALEASHGALVSHANVPNSTAFKSDLRDYAQQGYEVIICHGGEFAKAAKEIARQFPKSRIVVTGSAEGGEGIASLDFKLWEATYLCGVLASELSPDGPAGVIGAQNFSTVKNTMDAFVNGARSVRADYKADYQYVGSWDDVAKAKLTARSLIDAYRAQVLFQNTDAAAAGVIDAAKESKPTVLVFGCNSDQNGMAPEVVPASAIIDMKKAFGLMLDAIRDGKFEAKVYTHDLASGCVNVVLNPTFKERWPSGAMERMEAAMERIRSGKLDVLKP